MDDALATQLQALDSAHAQALAQYRCLHNPLAARMREAAQGKRRSDPIGQDLDEVFEAASALEKARIALHAFCAKHAECC